MPEKVHSHQETEKINDSECKVCPGCKKAKPLSSFFRTHRCRRPYGRRYNKLRLQIDHCVTCINETCENCPGCQESKPLTEFYYTWRGLGWSGVYSRSRYCHKCYCKATRASKSYRISISLYLKTLEAQGGVCALCSRGPAADLVPDHCHATDKFRGLLCRKCNLGLGLFDDSPAWLRAAAFYLDQRAR
jgi:hypothetical protein